MPITDLEHRLSIERTLDIFTMAPKVDLIAIFSFQALISATGSQITD